MVRLRLATRTLCAHPFSVCYRPVSRELGVWRKGEWTYADVAQRERDDSPRDQDLTDLIKVGRKQSTLARDRQG